MSKKYDINNISDVLNIPLDRFDDFLVDFKHFYEVAKATCDLCDEISSDIGLKTKTLPQHFVWIDDKKHDANIYLCADNNSKLNLCDTDQQEDDEFNKMIDDLHD